MSNGIFTMKKDLQCGPTVYWNPPKARSIPALLYLQITHESRIVNKRLKKQKKVSPAFARWRLRQQSLQVEIIEILFEGLSDERR